MARKTKADLVDLMNITGWTLKRGEWENLGEWNESFKWLAVKGECQQTLDVISKNDKTSWHLMYHHFRYGILTIKHLPF